MDEVAGKLRKSRRWLQDFLRDHPYYRTAGRTKLFTDEDVSRLIEALPCGNSSHRATARPSIGTSGENISGSLWITARELLTGARPQRFSRRGSGKPNSHSEPTAEARRAVGLPTPKRGRVVDVKKDAS
jgi:hypothetical protein